MRATSEIDDPRWPDIMARDAVIVALTTERDSLRASILPIPAELDEPTMRRWKADDGRGKIGVFLTYDQASAIHDALAKAGKDK